MDAQVNASAADTAQLSMQQIEPGVPGANPGPMLIAWKRRRVLEHMDANLGGPLRNRELAALVDLSEFHFNVAFRNSVGATPHEFRHAAQRRARRRRLCRRRCARTAR